MARVPRFFFVCDFLSHGFDVAIRCDACRRKRTINAEQACAIFGAAEKIMNGQRRLRCAKCEGRGGRMTPIPRMNA
jgi:hypothetical protein